MQEWYKKMIKERIDMIEDELFLKRIFIIVNDHMINEKSPEITGKWATGLTQEPINEVIGWLDYITIQPTSNRRQT